MPPVRRRTQQEASTTEVNEAANTEMEATEGVTEEATEGNGDKPKRTRTPKVFNVVDAELANELAGTDNIEDGDPVTGDMLKMMRDNGAKWDGNPDTNPGIKWVFGSNTAVPLRQVYQRHMAEIEDIGHEPLSLDNPDALYEALISGQGWVTLAARVGDGTTIQQVKEAVKDIVAENHDDADVMSGRPYGKGDNWTWVSGEALVEAKEANKNGEDEEDEEEGDEESPSTESEGEAEGEAGDAEDEDEAPKPAARRRRRAASDASAAE